MDIIFNSRMHFEYQCCATARQPITELNGYSFIEGTMDCRYIYIYIPEMVLNANASARTEEWLLHNR